MPTSNSKVFCRVNRRRPCRICGKPDWRSYVRDGERISICMRVSDGARKINRHGGAIFIHDDWREEKGIEVRVAADIPQSPIAPVKVRDFVYGRLINLSPATLYPGALIVGEKGLLARGLTNAISAITAGCCKFERARPHRAVASARDKWPLRIFIDPYYMVCARLALARSDGPQEWPEISQILYPFNILNGAPIRTCLSQHLGTRGE